VVQVGPKLQVVQVKWTLNLITGVRNGEKNFFR